MIGHSGKREQAVLIDDYPKEHYRMDGKRRYWYITYECFINYFVN